MSETKERNRVPMCARGGHVYVNGGMLCDCGLRSRSITIGREAFYELTASAPTPGRSFLWRFFSRLWKWAAGGREGQEPS